MAGRDHNFTRRAVLGAAFVAPALGCAGASVAAPPPADTWRRALAALRRAEAELGAFERRCRALGDALRDHDALDEMFGDRLDAVYGALRRLLRTPAPDLSALAMKIELTVDHEVGTLGAVSAVLLR
jgi:hypothetical protein